MDLIYAFRLPVPVDQAWVTLADLPRVAACLSGASVDAVTGEEATGQLTVKVGPVVVRYDGGLTVQQRDDKAGVAVLRATGTEIGGDGGAAATVKVLLSAERPGVTLVVVVVDLHVTGRIARFGRGVLSDVGERMAGQLAEGLGGELAMDVAVASLLRRNVQEAPVDDDAVDESAGEADVVEADAVEVVEVEMVETELGDPFEAVEPDATGLAEPPAAVEAPLIPGEEPTARTAGTWNPARPVTPAEAAAPVPSTARKVGPVIAAIALLWLLKKLLSRSRR